jgi:hypothetical protein
MLYNLTAVLLANAGVTAIVGAGVYYGDAPTHAEAPYVLVQHVTIVPENYQSEAPGVDAELHLVKPVATDVTNLKALVDAVDAALNTLGHCTGAFGVEFSTVTNTYWLPMHYRFWQSR